MWWLKRISPNDQPMNKTKENRHQRREINTVILQESKCFSSPFGGKPIVSIWKADPMRRDTAHQVLAERQQKGNAHRHQQHQAKVNISGHKTVSVASGGKM